MKTLYKAQATATGGRNGQVKSSDDVLNLEVRMPKELGGTGGDFTNPEQLFAAGYSACFDSALNHVARQQKISIKNTEVTATVGIGSIPSGGFGLEVALEVKIPGVARDVAEKLLQTAHQVCPYSNATRNNIEVSLTLVNEELV
ncbi:organic hydroperoxide resistance protein [Microscilla marina]|uniref:Organic hydroperoxide resistance protein n=1 Tax=Microscilla marina ATCC 23134 TaxID=313606 RepID=A1ZNP4_MICM2|nr:organic hydroperoxide resistance protein [Microscilla marina]EAY27933.1 organic hydroperoxide resistance protein [Microscilla marina ATCC 23134]